MQNQFALSIGQHLLGFVFLILCLLWWTSRLWNCFRRRWLAHSTTTSRIPEEGPPEEHQKPKKTFFDVEESRQLLGSIETEQHHQSFQQECSKSGDLENQEDESVVQIAVFPGENDHCLRIPVTECNVCLEQYQPGHLVRKSKACDHVFHRTCILEWLAVGKIECPCCRTEFVNLPSSAPISAFDKALIKYCIEDENL